MNQSRYLVALSVAGFGALAAFAACGDDDTTCADTSANKAGAAGSVAKAGTGGATTAAGGGGTDGGTGGTSEGGAGGSGMSGSGGVGGEGGAGPVSTITSVLSSSGTIYVANDVLFANFYQDDTIVRTPEEPGCVLYVRSLDKPKSTAGQLLVSGDHFGQAGGLASTLSLPADENDPTSYDFFTFSLNPPPSFFPDTPAVRLQIEKKATATFPAIAVTTLRTPTTDVLTVTAPTTPANGAVAMRASEGFEIKWTVPAAPADTLPAPRIVFGVTGLSTGDKVSDLRCGFPVSAGTGRVPASLLKELRTRLPKLEGNGTQLTGGRMHVWVGDQREIRSGDVSYVIEVARLSGTTFDESDATLDD